MLRLDDRWVWDFWFARQGSQYHVFYLQAPRSLGDPDARHHAASIGHAVSLDLRTWDVRPDALGPGPIGAWDDLATWTGSVLEHDGRWWMFYTGGSAREEGRIQRIGYATSTDLETWTKADANPVLVADPRWYERYDPAAPVWHEEAWRDPWVFRHPRSGEFHMFLCARVNAGAADARGVVGHARSADLHHWTAAPPVSEPGDFGHLEVPQLLHIKDRWYLLFSVYEWAHAATRLSRAAAVAGTAYLVADDPLGPFRPVGDEFLAGDAAGSRYAGKILEDPNGDLVYLAFSQFPDGEPFRGELSNPVPVHVDDHRRLHLIDPPAG